MQCTGLAGTPRLLAPGNFGQSTTSVASIKQKWTMEAGRPQPALTLILESHLSIFFSDSS